MFSQRDQRRRPLTRYIIQCAVEAPALCEDGDVYNYCNFLGSLRANYMLDEIYS